MTEDEASQDPQPAFPPFDLTGRLRRVRDMMRHRNYNSLIVSSPYLCRYILGINQDIALLAMDMHNAFAYQLQRSQELKLPHALQSSVEVRSTSDPLADIAKSIKQHAVVAFEENMMTYADYDRLMTLLPKGVSLRPAVYLTSSICASRDQGEIARTEAAARIIGNVLDSISEDVYSLSEKALADEIDTELASLGAREVLRRGKIPQIRTCVAYGVNTGDVTHSPGSAMLQSGQIAILSAGAVVDGYWAVETRTVGESEDPQLTTVRALVEELFIYVKQLMRTGSGVYATCGQVIASLRDARLAGLAPHAPCFSTGMQLGDSLCTGGSNSTWTACIEPGLYIPGKGGVRIGRTETVFASGQWRPKPIDLGDHDDLRGVPPYFSVSPTFDPQYRDRHTRILIGDYPETTWGGGV